MTAWPDQVAVEVADGVVAVLHGRGEAGVSNAGIVIDADADADAGGGDAHALVIDTMAFPQMATNLYAEVERRGATPTLVINTHAHIDHVGGNQLFAERGVPVVAHPVIGDTVRATGLPVQIYDAFMPAFRGEFAKLDLRPPDPIEAEPAPPLARGAQLHSFVPAHTAADTAVWLPGERILFTGDLCFFGVAPLAIQGLVSGWVAALDALAALAPDVVVPGHGPIGTVDDLLQLRDHLATVLDTGRRAVDAGADLDAAYAELDAGPVADWLEAERIKPNLERAMQEARHEISAQQLDVLPPSAFALLH